MESCIQYTTININDEEASLPYLRKNNIHKHKTGYLLKENL